MKIFLSVVLFCDLVPRGELVSLCESVVEQVSGFNKDRDVRNICLKFFFTRLKNQGSSEADVRCLRKKVEKFEGFRVEVGCDSRHDFFGSEVFAKSSPVPDLNRGQ